MKNKLLLFLGIFIILISATTGLASAASTETFVDDSTFSADGETGKPVSYNITLTHKAKLSIILSDECYGDYKIVITDKNTDKKIKTFTGNACFDEIKHTLTLSASQYTIRIYCTNEYYYFDGSLSYSIQDHREIVRFIEEGNGEAARTIMRLHILHVYQIANLKYE